MLRFVRSMMLKKYMCVTSVSDVDLCGVLQCGKMYVIYKY